MFAPLRSVATLVSLCLVAAGPAGALCSGQTLDHRLTPAETAELTATVAATPFAEGLIWQATKSDHSIVLVGTFHLADRRHDALLADLRPHLAKADRLLVEITTEGEADLQRRLGTSPDLLLLPDNGSLIEKLDPETWAAVSAAAEARQMPAFMAARMQPWYLTMSLAVPPCAMSDLLQGQRGLDYRLMQEAADLGVPVDAVEDWQNMLSLLRQGSFDEQVQMLQLVLGDPEVQSEAMASMIEDYFNGRIARIWELSRISSRWTPGVTPEQADAMFDTFSTALLVDRNRAWLPRIEAVAADNARLMVAVGAAHLPGTDGILVGLQSDGWTITRLD